jgi:hypothetical protein
MKDPLEAYVDARTLLALRGGLRPAAAPADQRAERGEPDPGREERQAAAREVLAKRPEVDVVTLTAPDGTTVPATRSTVDSLIALGYRRGTTRTLRGPDGITVQASDRTIGPLLAAGYTLNDHEEER